MHFVRQTAIAPVSSLRCCLVGHHFGSKSKMDRQVVRLKEVKQRRLPNTKFFEADRVARRSGTFTETQYYSKPQSLNPLFDHFSS